MAQAIRTYSRKQAGVIYRNVKEGKLEMSKAAISAMYDNCDGMDVYNNATADFAQYGIGMIRKTVDAIFANDFDKAQYEINDFEQLIAA